MRLNGKIAFISGAARGMGAAEAILFAKEGAAIGLGDVLETEGKLIEKRITELHDTTGTSLKFHCTMSAKLKRLDTSKSEGI